MGIRFEANYNRATGAAPYLPDDDPLSRWYRVHEWQVDTGFTGKLMLILVNSEDQFPPVTSAKLLGWVRIRALLDTTTNIWTTKMEFPIVGAQLMYKAYTPRLVIIPCGSGITFTAGQGLMTQALGGGTVAQRWWSCYVIDAQAV